MSAIDRKTLDQARVWAENEKILYETHAAAEVIQSLPDEWVDAGEVRNIIKRMGESIETSITDDYERGHDDSTAVWRDHLTDLLPAPRTLADMTPDERQACQWMWVDVTHANVEGEETMMLIRPRPVNTVVLDRNGYTAIVNNDQIVPLPDLPRMDWAGDGEQGAADD